MQLITSGVCWYPCCFITLPMHHSTFPNMDCHQVLVTEDTIQLYVKGFQVFAGLNQAGELNSITWEIIGILLDIGKTDSQKKGK